MKLRIAPTKPVSFRKPDGGLGRANVSQVVTIRPIDHKDLAGTVHWTCGKTGRSTEFHWDGTDYLKPLDLEAGVPDRVCKKLFAEHLNKLKSEKAFTEASLRAWAAELQAIAGRFRVFQGKILTTASQPMLQVYRAGASYLTSFTELDHHSVSGGAEHYHFSVEEYHDAKEWAERLSKFAPAHFGTMVRTGEWGPALPGHYVDAFIQTSSLLNGFRAATYYVQEGAKIDSVPINALHHYFHLLSEMGYLVPGDEYNELIRKPEALETLDNRKVSDLLYRGAHLVKQMKQHGKTNFPKYSSSYLRHLERFDNLLSKDVSYDQVRLCDIVQVTPPKVEAKPMATVSDEGEEETFSIRLI